MSAPTPAAIAAEITLTAQTREAYARLWDAALFVAAGAEVHRSIGEEGGQMCYRVTVARGGLPPGQWRDVLVALVEGVDG